MEYVLLLYDDEPSWSEPPPAGGRECAALERDLRGRDKLRAASVLHPVSTATTIAVRGGDTLVHDGPFAVTDEVLGGYVVVEAESLDEAIEWAQRIPTARTGHVEIRPAAGRVEADS